MPMVGNHPPETRRHPAMPMTWRARATWGLHLFKAATRQRHGELAPHFAPLIPGDAVVLDIGAHAGEFTKIFARLAPKGRVYAFEPGSYARSILLPVLRLRGLGNVTVLPLALGDAPGELELSMPVKPSGSYGFGLSTLAGRRNFAQSVSESVRVARLDDMVEELGLTRLDFIKADVEGWERRLLAGGERSLRRFRPALFLELEASRLERAGDSCAETWAFLRALGYRGWLQAGAELVAAEDPPRDGNYLLLAKS
jgi:FkbM family methyltransferase